MRGGATCSRRHGSSSAPGLRCSSPWSVSTSWAMRCATRSTRGSRCEGSGAMTGIHALCGGMIELDRSSFFSDVAPGTRITIPVMCFLISHPRGHVLVDTGVHRQARTDPVGRMGERRASLFGMRSAETAGGGSQLALTGLPPSDVRYVVNSHLHFDHCGGNEFFPSSTFLVQRAEMEAARRVLGGEGVRGTPRRDDV